jgi:hypothetical protein
VTPPSSTPAITAHPVVSILKLNQSKTRTALDEMMVKIHVAPNPMEKAAESLNTRFNFTKLPRKSIGCPGFRVSIRKFFKY